MLNYEFLCDKAKEFYEEIVIERERHFLDSLKQTKSPIEQILCVTLERTVQEMDFWLFPQRKIVINEKLFIVDFAITIPGSDDIICVIECDGHDFHEKTKDQVIKDKKRDRTFQSEGIPIFRFTGSEIYNSPYTCVREIANFLKKLR
ncbi:endonuclease domain-containing protein [Chryseomicrobium palamuruense]